MLVCLALAVVASVRLDAPFSSTFDGLNTGLWATGARQVRDDGWIPARLGAGDPNEALREQMPYAHHPPLVRVEVALAESALGEHRWVDRLPALLSALAAVWLCWGWLGALGFSTVARSVGVLVAGGTSMLLVYGLMLNMEAVWLPFAFGLLLLWRLGERGYRVGTACLLVGLVGALAAHQGLLLVGALAVIGLVRARRERRRLEPYELAALVASVVGAVLFLAWVIWAAGDLGDLVRIARVRTDGAVTWAQWAGSQLSHGLVVFGILGLAAMVAGPLLVRRRPAAVAPMVALWAVGATYAVVFRQGADIHPYWNVALLPAVALGAALCSDRLEHVEPRAARAVLAVALAVLVATTATSVRDAPVGTELGQLARIAGRGTSELYTTEVGSAWLRYESGRATVGHVTTCDDLSALALRNPTAIVLVHRRWVPRRAAWASVVAAPEAVVRRDAALVPAGVLVSACL